MMDLPDAVRSYLTDDYIGVAVDALAGMKVAVPAKIGWDELPAYYEAVAAALHVKAMYAATVQRLWNAVWDEAVEGLEPAHSDDDVWHALPNSVDDCWSEHDFGRSFRLPARMNKPTSWLCTDVGLDRHEVNIGVSISSMSAKKLLIRLPGFAQAASKEWVYLSAGKLLGATDPIPEIRQHAQNVVRIALED